MAVMPGFGAPAPTTCGCQGCNCKQDDNKTDNE